MGIHGFPATMLGKLPTYYVTDTVQEDAGGGNVRIWNYTNRNGVLVPLYQCIFPSRRLVTVGRMVAEFAQDILKSEEVRAMGMKVH